MTRVAFIGLGVMGFPMAGHLAAKGHDVTVFNRTAARAEAWCERYRGQRADTPRAAATRAEMPKSLRIRSTAKPKSNRPETIVLEESRRNGSALPVTALVDQFYRSVQEKGGGKGDTSSLILNLRDK